MTNVLSPVLKQKFFDNNGRPAVGYKLFTYEAGTSTKLDTYPDEDTSSPNTNPIILDFRGEANVWTPPNVAYKFVLAAPNDTDPPTAPILSVDNVVDSQLVTLYGGVDTGIANAYVLNFVANFDAYTDGIIIYWIPSNTNTGTSTINVNGLGPVAILNQDGSTLTPGQIVANQITAIIYKGTGFRILSTAIQPLYGGVSTGGPTAYLLAATQFSAYFEGMIIYWIPNATYVGGSVCSINVNGLGDQPILNGDGSSLEAGQLVAGQVAQIIFTLGSFRLVGAVSGAFTVTLTGITATVTGTARWTRIGRLVSLLLPALSGTSNASTKTYTGLPNSLRPAFNVFSVSTGVNNSAAAQEVITVGIAAGSNVISFARLTSDGLWTSSGTCSVSGGTIVYEATG